MSIYAFSLYATKNKDVNHDNQFIDGHEIKVVFSDPNDNRIISKIIDFCVLLQKHYYYVSFGYERINITTLQHNVYHIVHNTFDNFILSEIFRCYREATNDETLLLLQPFRNRMCLDIDNKKHINITKKLLDKYENILSYNIKETKNGYHIRIYPVTFDIKELYSFVKELISYNIVDESKFVLQSFNNMGIDILFNERWKIKNGNIDYGKESNVL